MEGRLWPPWCPCRRSFLERLLFDSGCHSGEGGRGRLCCSESQLCMHNGPSCDCKGFGLVGLTDGVDCDSVWLVWWAAIHQQGTVLVLWRKGGWRVTRHGWSGCMQWQQRGEFILMSRCMVSTGDCSTTTCSENASSWRGSL